LIGTKGTQEAKSKADAKPFFAVKSGHYFPLTS